MNTIDPNNRANQCERPNESAPTVPVPDGDPTAPLGRRIRRLMVVPLIALAMVGAIVMGSSPARAAPAAPSARFIEGAVIQGRISTQNVHLTLTDGSSGEHTREIQGLPREINGHQTDNSFHYATPLFLGEARVSFVYRMEGTPYEVYGEMVTAGFDHHVHVEMRDAATHQPVDDHGYYVGAEVKGDFGNRSYEIEVIQ